jgi:fructosamine-3-kinase
MNVPPNVIHWISEHGFGNVSSSLPVAGGCISNGTILKTDSGDSFFLKQNHGAQIDMFQRETEGLLALDTTVGPRVPEPYIHGPQFLLLEDLSPGQPANDYWETLGRQLASLHQGTHPKFGFDHDNYIGSTPQPNAWNEDGYVFFAENRLQFQALLAEKQGLLENEDLRRVESIISKLDKLVPPQQASLIHGDLWSGNAISDSDGQPVIIDPAVHYGWAEAELGMTALFGGFPGDFYQAYLEVTPLIQGWRERFPIYNLYHLLNHLNIFGSGYLGQVRTILNRFA